ncbi:MAG: ribulose-phosphate 3-epimerase [Gammaproteobacteria bacterium]|nr:ribulose-phosphate 3-epimerase [Gammaproteobacteria bacterium]
MSKYLIAPSILSADFSRLGEEIGAVVAAGADLIHFDVMDNHYVPNLTIGPLVMKSLRQAGIDVPIDVHLMATPVDSLLEEFLGLKPEFLTIHPESTQHLHRSLALIREGGAKAGVALNPETPPETLRYVMELVDLVLVMSVNPGFGGQQFIEESITKVRDTRAMIDASGRHIRLEVDGGIKADNIARVAEAGADTFVAGSAVFGAKDYGAVIEAMRRELSALEG